MADILRPMDLASFIQTYGLWAVAVGSVLEGETLVLLAGAAAHMGLLDVRAVVAVAALGAFVGDNMWFCIGRRFGPRLMLRFPKLAAASPRIEKLLARWSWGAVIALRFAYGLRSAGPAILGSTGLPAWQFVAANALGALLWACLIAGLGYAAGQAIEPMLSRIVHAEKVLLALLAAIAVLGIAAHIWRRRRATWRGH